jgi:hypothetical protein
MIVLDYPTLPLQGHELLLIPVYLALLLHLLYAVPDLVLPRRLLRLVPLVPLVPLVVRTVERLLLV